MDPSERRIAWKTVDRPLDYLNFEGVSRLIGADVVTVELWDSGSFTLEGEGSMLSQWEAGELLLNLKGERLNGRFSLARLKPENQREPWLLLKHEDAFVRASLDTDSSPCSTAEAQLQKIPKSSPSSKLISITRGKLSRLPGARPSPMMERISPQLATLVEKMPQGRQWSFEVKWNGIRSLCFLQDGRLELVSRNGRALTGQFPQITSSVKKIHATEAILDGEIVIFDEQGRTNFQALQPHLRTSAIVPTGEAVLILFDLLYLDGYDLREVSLLDRTRLLASTIEGSAAIQVSPQMHGKGQLLLDFAKIHGLEGIMAKDSRSKYEEQRSSNWQKIKLIQEQDCIICGYIHSNKGLPLALVLGIQAEDSPAYVGKATVSSDAFSSNELKRLLDRHAASDSPFTFPTPLQQGRKGEQIVWTKGDLVGRVQFEHWDEEGLLVSAVLIGLRDDIHPSQCIRDEITPDSILTVESIQVQNPMRAPVPLPQPIKDAARAASPEPEQPDSVEVRPGEHSILLTDLNKIYFPKNSYTKSDLIAYYSDIAEILLPHLADRPLLLHPYPQGIRAKAVSSPDISREIPEWMTKKDENGKSHIVCNDRSALLMLVNIGCIGHASHISRAISIDRPDYLVLSLTPNGCSYEKVIEAALTIRRLLEGCELESYPKTSGLGGLDICIPLDRSCSFQEATSFGRNLTKQAVRLQPSLMQEAVSIRSQAEGIVLLELGARKGDFSTTVYSIRAREDAPISTPLLWKQINRKKSPMSATLRSIGRRLEKHGDLFAPTLNTAQVLPSASAFLKQLAEECKQL